MAIAAMLAFVACTEPLPTAPWSPPHARMTAPGATTPQPEDPNALGRSIPGFGGFFIDDSGVPTVYLREPARRPELERALASFFLADGLDPGSLRVLPGRYDFIQLEAWFDRAAPAAMSIAGAVFADLDEASNRLHFGVEHAALESVRSRLQRLGIPAAAFTVEETLPIRPLATLQDPVQPVVGGLEIGYTGGWRCTLGFNVKARGVSSFVTASHCSIRYGSDDGTSYTQPGGTSPVGTEVSDPPFFTKGACPAGRRCRYSDAARAAYAAGVPFFLGRIARTTDVNDGSLEIAGSFSIVRERGGSVGSIANKVGQKSGWSQGRLTRSCVTTNVVATNVTLLCQHWVAAAAREGDSGAPVFLGSAGGVALAGVLWGGDAAGTIFVFSPIGNVERELGSLTTF